MIEFGLLVDKRCIGIVMHTCTSKQPTHLSASHACLIFNFHPNFYMQVMCSSANSACELTANIIDYTDVHSHAYNCITRKLIDVVYGI